MRELRNATLSSPGLPGQLGRARARERTVTEDVSPTALECSLKRYWQPGEVPLLTPLIGEFPKHDAECLLVFRRQTAAIVWE